MKRTLRYRIQIYWSASGTPARMGQQLAALLASFAWIDERLTGWLFEDESGALVPLAAREICERAVVQSAIEWRVGRETRVCYQPHLFNRAEGPPEAEITLTGGVEPLPLEHIFAPNRLELCMRVAPGEALASRQVLEDTLRAAVAVFRPDFGHAGSMSVPQPAQAIFDEGAPVVGWLTYLSAAYPALPALPPPAIAQPVSDLGTLVAAHPDPFDDDEPAHFEAVERVRQALKAAGVLVPASTLAAGRQ